MAYQLTTWTVPPEMVVDLPSPVVKLVSEMCPLTYADLAQVCSAFQQAQNDGITEGTMYQRAFNVWHILNFSVQYPGIVTYALAANDLLDCECTPDGYRLCEACASIAGALR